jgi:hypothetical protein
MDSALRLLVVTLVLVDALLIAFALDKTVFSRS